MKRRIRLNQMIINDGALIACDNDSCPMWFHIDWVNIDSIPDGKWFCPVLKT